MTEHPPQHILHWNGNFKSNPEIMMSIFWRILPKCEAIMFPFNLLHLFLPLQNIFILFPNSFLVSFTNNKKFVFSMMCQHLEKSFQLVMYFLKSINNKLPCEISRTSRDVLQDDSRCLAKDVLRRPFTRHLARRHFLARHFIKMNLNAVPMNFD